MDGQLFKDLDALTKRIQYLSPSDESLVANMQQQLAKERQGIEDLFESPAKDLAKAFIVAITDIPYMVRSLMFLLEKEDCTPEWRHAIVLALVYLVRSDDLIPDESPGGYGFIDDYIVLRMTVANAFCDSTLIDWVSNVWVATKRSARG